MTRTAPVIVVLGATACGKSRLSIELAKCFNGEIISADSMQVYKGLDIVSNKVTEEEQQQARHHMIDFLDPSSRFSVIDFKNKSLEIINDLHKKQKVPIIVGGTNYYIESLLWKSFILGPTLESSKRDFDTTTDNIQDKTLIDTESKLLQSIDKEALHKVEDYEDVEKFFAKPIYNFAFEDVESEKLWNVLEKVDPMSAHTYHPRDKRRVIRCLQIIQEKKKSYSEVLQSVNKSRFDDRKSLGGPIRFESTLVIWLNCDKEALDCTMDARVETMLDRGLLAELERFHDEYNKKRLLENKKLQYDKGIFQTIGFKEFHDYFMLNPDARDSEEGNLVLRQSIERMKISTRQYAKRQVKWIRRRFLQSGTRDLPTLFKLEAAFDDESWVRQVQQPAIAIVSHFLQDNGYPDELMAFKKEPEVQEVTNEPGKLFCEICNRTFIGSVNIESHLNSKLHYRNVVKQDKLKKLEMGQSYCQTYNSPTVTLNSDIDRN